MSEHDKMLYDVTAEAKQIANRLISPIEQYLIAKRKLDKVLFEQDEPKRDSAYKNLTIWKDILDEEFKNLVK